MNKNPIRKMHVGWTSPWTADKQPKSIKAWVAVCPKCNLAIKAKQPYWYGNTPKTSRKTAKDALHYHMRTLH